MNVFGLKHPLFKVSASLNPYVGCIHGCLYCPFSGGEKIGVKTDYIHLLEKKLGEEKEKMHLALGSITEPYMEIEKELNLTHHTIEIVMKNEFPIQIFTKSDLILRDMDLLKEYSAKGLLAVSVSFTTFDSKLSQMLEPDVTPVDLRVKLLQELKNQDIFCGMVLSPIIPYVNDSKKSIEEIFDRAKKNGAEYVVPQVMAITNDNVRKKINDFVSKKYKKIEQEFNEAYKENTLPDAEYAKKINGILFELSEKYEMPLYLPTEEEEILNIDIRQEMLK